MYRACLMVALAGTLAMRFASAQTGQAARFDWTNLRLGTPYVGGPLVLAGDPATCDVIGYTTDDVVRHYYTLADLPAAAADLVADGHALVPVHSLAPGSLDGIDQLVVGLVAPRRTLVPAQIDVVEDFVRSGGKLVFLGENLAFASNNAAVGGRFGIVYPDVQVFEIVVTDVHPHPITDGPFGAVHRIDGSSNTPGGFGSMRSPGPHGTSLADFPDGDSALVVIEPNALAPGSGTVVALAEINIFRETYLRPDNRVLWRNLFAYVGALTFGFDTDDDFVTPFANGQALASPQEFGRVFTLSAAGPNAGAAAFDSTPGGPNDPSQDRDLLVGRGKVLILQNSQVTAQSQAGVFDRPNDDQDGGVLRFEFQAPVQVFSLVLVDIDGGSEQSSSVVLVDAADRTRTYSVPARWTEDLLLDGPPGWRTLDLTRLDPQPGFLSIATAVEVPGFEPRDVVRLEVHLGSSGAIDDLRLARFCR